MSTKRFFKELYIFSGQKYIAERGGIEKFPYSIAYWFRRFWECWTPRVSLLYTNCIIQFSCSKMLSTKQIVLVFQDMLYYGITFSNFNKSKIDKIWGLLSHKIFRAKLLLWAPVKINISIYLFWFDNDYYKSKAYQFFICNT
jgi:hypothetical protein